MHALVITDAFGKSRPWQRIAQQKKWHIRFVATGGHVARFPQSLEPLGIEKSKEGIRDMLRQPLSETHRLINEFLLKSPPDEKIFIATDNDAEGEQLAMDITMLIFRLDRNLINRTLRLRMNAITAPRIQEAIRAAEADAHENLTRVTEGSITCNVSMLFDRWMAGAYSRSARIDCGRVRAALLGTSLFWTASPAATNGLPQTGEITLLARSSSGGVPFLARVAIDGKASRALVSLASRFKDHYIPGSVEPGAERADITGAEPGVQGRFGVVELFNTADALAYASRHFGIPAEIAMRGLQQAYEAGRISHPRTHSRGISPESIDGVLVIARNCGVYDVDRAHLERISTGTAAAKLTPETPPDQLLCHEGIYPTVDDNSEMLAHLRRVARNAGNEEINYSKPEQVADLMTALVTRRAIEAARSGLVQEGRWIRREDARLSLEDQALLASLDWRRPAGPALPWTQWRATAIRTWPLEAVLIDGMAREKIGRPGTIATHVAAAVQNAHIASPGPGHLPVPTEHGMQIMRALPIEAASSEMCRMIDAHLKATAAGEQRHDTIPMRVLRRVQACMNVLPEPIKAAMINELRISHSAARTYVEPPAPIVQIEHDITRLSAHFSDPVYNPNEGIPDFVLS